jgi:hypothetical protein
MLNQPPWLPLFSILTPEEGVYEVRLVKYDYCQRLTMQTIDARAEQKRRKGCLL